MKSLDEHLKDELGIVMPPPLPVELISGPWCGLVVDVVSTVREITFAYGQNEKGGWGQFVYRINWQTGKAYPKA